MQLNRVAFCTTAAFGAATVGSAFKAVTTATAVATVAYSTLAVVSMVSTVGAFIAWNEKKPDWTTGKYLCETVLYSGAIVLVSKNLIQQCC